MRAAISGDNGINARMLSHCPLASMVSNGCGPHGLVLSSTGYVGC